MVAPVLPLSVDTVPDAMIVVAMVILEVYLLTQILPRTGPPPTLTRMILGSSALLGSAGVLMAISAAAMQPDLSSYTIVLLAFNFMMMAPPGLWIIAVILYQDRRVDPAARRWPIAISAMATMAEVLMGLVFVVSDSGPTDLATVLAGTLTSAWYLWSMAAAMFALLAWVRLPRLELILLGGLATSAVAAPWAPLDLPLGAGLMAAVMTLTFSLTALELGRASHGRLAARSWPLARAVLVAFLGMMSGLLAIALLGSTTGPVFAFGMIMTGLMGAEFAHLVRVGLFRPGPAGPPAPDRAELPAPVAAP